MLNIIIVDDEPTIRKGLTYTIQWQEHGCHVVGSAKNGLEALSYCENHHIDIIISDIKMPKMDGLQLLEVVKREFPGIYFIIISGYDEFELAQKAINLGAYAYILKPIEPQEILDTVKKIQQAMSNQTANKEMITKNMIRDSLLGLYKPEIYHTFSEDIRELKDHYFCIMTIQYDQYRNCLNNNDINNIISSVNRFHRLLDINDETLMSFNLGPESIVFCGLDRHTKNLEQRIHRFSQNIYDKIDNNMGFSISIGIGRIYKGISNINLSYIESLKALNYTFVESRNRVCRYSQNMTHDTTILYPFLSYENDIIELLLTNDIQSIKNKLTVVLTEMKASNTSLQDMELFVRNILYKSINAISKADMSLNDITSNPHSMIQNIFMQPSANDMFKSLTDFLDLIGSKLTTYTNEHVFSLLVKVKQYLNDNFADPSLSLAGVASHVHIHPAYLSAIFTKYEKLNFIDYLTHLRIEKAKYLLQHSTNKICAITNMVGYQNSSYFSTLFKKTVGYTPSKYRQLHIENRAALS